MAEQESARQWRAERQAKRERALMEPGVVEARSPGTCPVCGAPFQRGEPIRHTPEGWQPVVACCGGGLDQ